MHMIHGMEPLTSHDRLPFLGFLKETLTRVVRLLASSDCGSVIIRTQSTYMSAQSLDRVNHCRRISLREPVGCEVIQRVANPKGLSYGNTSEVLSS